MRARIKTGCGRSGQTLIMTVVALVILLLAGLFLFDLQSVVRLKIKSQTAVDAAALVGAKWQVNTLNMIGELNIVEACTVLVSALPEPFTGDDPPEETIPPEVALISNMQARAAFIGPLIGLGAAQQAAKSNGLYTNSFYTSVVERHIGRLAEDISSPDEPGDTYEMETDTYYDILKLYRGFQWRIPYLEMLEEVNGGQGGLAVAPNAQLAGLPIVTPDWLMDVDLYNAIAARYWCYFRLRTLLKTFDFEGKWWDVAVVSNSSNFPYESEYFPVFVDFTSTGFPFPEEMQELLDARRFTAWDTYDPSSPRDTDGIYSPLPYVQYCTYDSCWSNTIGGESWDMYLRSPLRTEYSYGGPVVKMTAEVEPPVVSQSYFVGSDNQIYSRGGEVVMPVGGEDSGMRKQYLNSSICTALAKPLGSLDVGGSSGPPHTTEMVLPVFDKARLIPIALQDPGGMYDPFDQVSEQLYQFLLWLQDVDDIDRQDLVPPGSMGPFFLSCLRKLNDPEWRNSGYNREYEYSPPGETPPYDSATGAGAGWLQMGYSYQYDGTGQAVAILETNEDRCTYWPSGGGGGSRPGPSVLH